MGWTGGGGGTTPPVFGPSGPSHSTGLVPDPGSVAGTTKFLREDTTWVVPSGTGGGMSIGGAITSGTANSVLFVGAGSVLAQDPTHFAFLDSSPYTLQAGGVLQQLVNGVFVNALFPVYNASANSWFIGNSGNTSGTGKGNMGLGDLALGSLSTGGQNVGVGSNANASLTSGGDNVAIGYFAVGTTQTGTKNVGIGSFALGSVGNTSSANTGIGYNALTGLASTGNSNNTAVGYQAGQSVTSGSNNTLLGGWSGPSGAMSNVIALSDGAGNLLLDYNYTTSSVWTINLSAFGVLQLISANTQATALRLNNTSSGGHDFYFYSTGSANSPGHFGVFDNTSGISPFDINGTTGAVVTVAGGLFGLSASSSSPQTGADTAFSRIAAGVLAAGNGTAGNMSGTMVASMYQVPLNAVRVNALFGVYNATFNNWFVGNSGNTTTTGNANMGMGGGALAAVTTGAGNLAIGSLALNACDAGGSNTALGLQAAFTISGSASQKNTVIGALAGYSGTTSYHDNTLVGYYSGNALGASAAGNAFIGSGAGYQVTSGSNNTLIGGWPGPSGAMSSVIALSDGAGNLRLDYGYTAAGTWTFPQNVYIPNTLFMGTGSSQITFGSGAGTYALGLVTGVGISIFDTNTLTNPASLYVYNNASGATEWCGIDWQLTANVASIGTQKSGTGSVRSVDMIVGGTRVLRLPPNAGTNGYVLQTDGTGITSWVAPGAATVAIGGAVTGGTTNSILYVASGPVLAQDNAAFSWTDSTKTLLAGTMFQQLVNSVATPALFGVYNASANNWFVGNSGNTSTTGSNNIGLGDGAVGSVTSGKDNIGIGYACVGAANTGIRNIGIGYQALLGVTAASNNVALGAFAGNTLNGSTNMCIGYSALGSATGNTTNNVCVGANSLTGITGVTSGNTAIGSFAGNNITSGNNNTLIGAWGGPSGAMSNVIALSDGAGNLRLDYQYTLANYWSFAAQVRSTINGAFNVDLGGANNGCFSVYNGATLLGMMRGDGNVAGTQVETIDDATAAISQAAGLPPIGMKMFSGGCISWTNNVHWWDTSDTTMSRNAAGIVQVGTGTTGNALGTLFASVFGGPGGLANAAPNLPSINTAFTGSAPGAALTSISNATPAVFTLTGHGLFGGQPILLTTTGTLPSPLAINTTYYVDNATLGANAFEVSTTYGGAVVNTTTAGSGTHSFAPGGVVTILIGANSTVTLTNHGMVPGQAFKFATTGALPTGITAGTTYYVLSGSWQINSFRYSATPNGATITTSGTQSGTQTITLDSATANQPNAALNFGPSAILGGQISAGYRFTQYWNTTGTPLGAFIVNAVNINSVVGGKIFDVQQSGTSLFNIQTASTGCTIVPSAPFNLSPGGTKRLDFGNTIANAWSFFAEVALIAGTASVPPLVYPSGTVLTTAAAGACEFDGTCFYETALASSRQVVNTEQTQNLNATRTFTNNTSAQAIFNATANGALTIGIGTYEFEMLVDATGFSASAHTINAGFAGTATYTMTYYFDAQAVGSATPTSSATGFIATNAATAIIASATTTGLLLYCRGTVRCTVAGTFIPQLTQVTASAAAVVAAGSFVRLWPIGNATATSVGNWS